MCNSFIKENKVSTGNQELDDTLNSLIEGMPEFVNVIGKQQHSTQALSVDAHILKVLQEAVNNENYDSLSDIDKTCLKFATVMHDIAKQEGVVDDAHPEASALYARNILEKYTFSDDVNDRIFELVKNHHWLEAYNKGEVTPDYAASLFRHKDDYSIAKIMAESDLKGVSEQFYEQFKSALNDESQAPLADSLASINKTGELIFTSKIIQENKIPTVKYNGEEYKVIDFNSLSDDIDLFEYGFTPGTTKGDIRLYLHMAESVNKLETVDLLSDVAQGGFLCASYIDLDNTITFGTSKFGVSLEAENVNIANAWEADQSSGFLKGFEEFSNIITGNSKSVNNEYRSYVPDKIKSNLGLNDSEYAQLYSQLASKKYITQIKDDEIYTFGDKSFKGSEIKQAVQDASDSIIIKGQFNEANLYNPKINALVAKVDDMSEIPQEYLDFAKEHDLPIYLIGDNAETKVTSKSSQTSSAPKKQETEILKETDSTKKVEAVKTQQDVEIKATYDAAQQKQFDEMISKFEAEGSDKAKDIIEVAKASEQTPETIERLKIAYDVLQGGECDVKLRTLANEISNYLSSNDNTEGTLNEIMGALGIKLTEIKPDEDGILHSSYGNNDVSARAKGEDSVYSKLRNKMFSLKNDMPETASDALELIHDAQGLRINIETTKPTVENIGTIEGIKESEKELFCQYLQDSKTKVTPEQKQRFDNATKTALENVAHNQSKEFVNSLCNAIEKGEIHIREVENYCGKDGIPYLSRQQLDKIEESYEKWFKNTLADASDSSRFTKIETEKGTCLYDNQTGKTYEEKLVVCKTKYKENGYCATQIGLVNEAGQYVELQYRGSEVDSLAKWEHIIYDVKKGKETVAGEKYENIRNVIKKINDEGLLDEYERYFSDTFDAQRRIELGNDCEIPDIKNYEKLINALTKEEIEYASYIGIIKVHDSN